MIPFSLLGTQQSMDGISETSSPLLRFDNSLKRWLSISRQMSLSSRVSPRCLQVLKISSVLGQVPTSPLILSTSLGLNSRITPSARIHDLSSSSWVLPRLTTSDAIAAALLVSILSRIQGVDLSNLITVLWVFRC